MPSVLYVGLRDADKIAVFSIDDASTLSKQAEVPVDSPSVMAVGPDGRMLYIGQRAGPASANGGPPLPATQVLFPVRVGEPGRRRQA